STLDIEYSNPQKFCRPQSGPIALCSGIADGTSPKRGVLGRTGNMPGPRLVIKEPAVPVLPLRRNRDFKLLWSGQVLSVSGAQIVAVALVDGIGAAFFSVGERSALRRVVADEQLEAAMVRNQAREFGALLGGQPLGGVLFGLGRLVPFLFDAVSYLVSVVSLLLIRTPFQ